MFDLKIVQFCKITLWYLLKNINLYSEYAPSPPLPQKKSKEEMEVTTPLNPRPKEGT